MLEVWPEKGGIIETVFIENCDLDRVLSAIEESPHMSFDNVDYITIKGETDVNSQPEVGESIIRIESYITRKTNSIHITINKRLSSPGTSYCKPTQSPRRHLYTNN